VGHHLLAAIAAIPSSWRKKFRVDKNMLDADFSGSRSRLPALPPRKDGGDHRDSDGLYGGIDGRLGYESAVNAAGEGDSDTVDFF
jgi:hypothetical protein